MFFFSFLAAWQGSVMFVVVWALLGLIFSKRSLFQSLILIVLVKTFGAPTVMAYIAVWWIFECVLAFVSGKKNTVQSK